MDKLLNAFTGTYEQQEHAAKRLQIVIPVALMIILLILYFQFRSVTASLILFSGVFVAFAGGFILMWLYGQPWFMDFTVCDVNMRTLFGMDAQALADTLAALTKQLPDSDAVVRLANAMWVEQSTPVKPEFLKVNQEKLGAEVFRRAFTEETLDELNG